MNRVLFRGWRSSGCWWLPGLAGVLLEAASPEVQSLFPAGGRQGEVVSVSLSGDPGSAPLALWADDAGLVLEGSVQSGQARLAIGSEVPTGPHLLRFHNAGGCTPPLIFEVGEAPEIVEPDLTERETAGEEIQRLPVTVNGRLRHAGETDRFFLQLEAGDVLHATVTAAGLDSPLRSRLTLIDSQGHEVGVSTNAGSLDPVLEQRIWTSGRHRLFLSGVGGRTNTSSTSTSTAGDGLTGIYRLSLSSTEGRRPHAAPGAVLFESPPTPGVASSVVVRADAEWVSTQHPETLPPTLDLPGSFTGFINPPGDEDRFSFLGRKDELHRFRLHADSINAPFKAALRILDITQHVLATTTAAPDSTLEWVVPWDGPFIVTVADEAGGGGPDFQYQLELLPPEPRLTAVVDQHTLSLEPGSSRVLRVRLQRPPTHRGFLAVTTTELPAGVTADHGVIHGDGSETTVRLTASRDAAPVNRPFQIRLLDTAANPMRFHTARAPLQGKHTPTKELLLHETATLWLTVVPAGP